MLIITERDKKLFKFLSKFKYATVNQISNYLGISIDGAYQRLSKLQRGKYLDSCNIGLNKKYYSNGSLIRARMEKSIDQKKVEVSFMSLEHHLKVTDFFLDLLDRGIKEEMILTSRDIFRTRIGISANRKRLYKVPDLVIKRDDERLIAIEIELSKKNNQRLGEVFDNYILNTSYYAVYYLCDSKAVKNRINRTVKKKLIDFIRAYDMSEFKTEFIFRE
jgi:DNA-binding Lrp family transcriptional regulator